MRFPLPSLAPRAAQPAAGLPYALSVVDADTLGAPRPAVSLEEMLRVVPGISVDNRHNLSQGDRLSVRGLGVRSAFGVRGLKVVLDGIPLTTADGQTQLNNLDLGSVGASKSCAGPARRFTVMPVEAFCRSARASARRCRTAPGAATARGK